MESLEMSPVSYKTYQEVIDGSTKIDE